MPSAKDDKTVDHIRFDKILYRLIHTKHVGAKVASVAGMRQSCWAKEKFTAPHEETVRHFTVPVQGFMEIAAVKSFSTKGSEELLVTTNFSMDPEILDHKLQSVPVICYRSCSRRISQLRANPGRTFQTTA